ncbi:hypothetical protein [Nocardioides albus]|uniref:Uncharacterized protein n=1 Tax=Nocardioides albus TaxID=1841 RepID=A0A7W5F7B6_9ACTN|nr:hypothetical protein [Nocardioides albus]MBB3087687.1 hypothetical protein [Nocardioides albus]
MRSVVGEEPVPSINTVRRDRIEPMRHRSGSPFPSAAVVVVGWSGYSVSMGWR